MALYGEDQLNGVLRRSGAVSYTHLDVYKRQAYTCALCLRVILVYNKITKYLASKNAN